jgi:protein SCO1/2
MNLGINRRCLIAILALAGPMPAVAAISPEDYRKTGFSLPARAQLPLDAAVEDDSGKRRILRDLITEPTVLVFADYTCTTLCGPIVAFVASALEQSGLRAGEQYRFLAIGLDPKDRAADAANMRRAHLGGNADLNRASDFVHADQATIERLTAALGYRYSYDREHDQFIHPGAAYVLGADGRVARVLTGLGLSGNDMRLALVEAGEGRIGTLGDQVRMLCSGFDPAHGVYNVAVSRVLAATGFATMLALGGLIGALLWAGRRRSA